MQDPPSLGAPCSQSYRTGTAADTSQLLLVLEPRALLAAPHPRHSQHRFRYRHEPALLCKAPRTIPSTTRWHGCLCLPVLLKRASCPEQNSTKGTLLKKQSAISTGYSLADGDTPPPESLLQLNFSSTTQQHHTMLRNTCLCS